MLYMQRTVLLKVTYCPPLVTKFINLELRTISKHKAEMLKNGTVTYYPSAVHVV